MAVNYEEMLRLVIEAREAAEAAEKCMQTAEHPSVSDCGEAFVYARGAAEILEGLEKDLRSEILQATVAKVQVR